MAEYSFQAERIEDESCGLAHIEASSYFSNAIEAWDYFIGLLTIPGEWTCTLHRGDRALKPRVFIVTQTEKNTG